jgi:hypothetical protein
VGEVLVHQFMGLDGIVDGDLDGDLDCDSVVYLCYRTRS